MSKYYSVYYRGFLIEQTEKGWQIALLPIRSDRNVISRPPYSTVQIAKHIVDRLIEDNNVTR